MTYLGRRKRAKHLPCADPACRGVMVPKYRKDKEPLIRCNVCLRKNAGVLQYG